MNITRSRRIRTGLAFAALGASLTLVPGGSASAGVIQDDITSCTFSPSEFTWASQEDVVVIPVNVTPDQGVSAFSASAKPDGGTESVVFDNFGDPSVAPPNGADFFDAIGGSYESLLEALGGVTGNVYLAIYLPTATSIADTPLCEVVIRVIAPEDDLPETGSESTAMLLGAVMLLVAGTVMFSRRRTCALG